jgi:hypothetical protein
MKMPASRENPGQTCGHGIFARDRPADVPLFVSGPWLSTGCPFAVLHQYYFILMSGEGLQSPDVRQVRVKNEKFSGI